MLRRRQIFNNFLKITQENVCVCNRDFSVNFQVRPELIKYCENVFRIPTNKVQSMMLEHPSLQKMKEEQIEERLAVLKKYSVSPKTVSEYPIILKTHPLTIDNRMTVLKECGFRNIKLTTLARFVAMVTKSSIGELKKKQHLDDIDDIWEDLVKCFSEWPVIQKKLKKHKPFSDVTTLFDIRQEILQKFLYLSLNLSEEDFKNLTNTYLRLKHKSLRNISQTIHLSKNVIGIPIEKIAANGFLFYADPDNIRMMLQEVQDLGGMDIKEAIVKNPILLTYDYKKLMKIKEIFKQSGIPQEAQGKCFRLFTLSPETVQERLEEIKSVLHFKGLADNPRMLQVVYKRKAVGDRLVFLHSKNKRCSSLHKLTAGSKEFDRFAGKFGDRTRGVDTVVALHKTYENTLHTMKDIRCMLSKHQYWTHTALMPTMNVFEFLQEDFSLDDIFFNCQLLFYPLEEVKKITGYLLGKQNSLHEESIESCLSGMSRNDFSKSQILGLTAYFLERDTQFTGAGIWQDQPLKL